MFDRTIRRILLLATCVALPGLATADESEFSRPGFYLGLAGNTAFSTSAADELEDATGVDIDVDPSLGLHARAGFRFHPRFAAEAHYEWASGFNVSAMGVDALEIDGHAITGDLKFFLMTGRFQPFAVVGLGAMVGEVEDTVGAGFSVDEADFAARFGGGIDFYLTEKIAVNLDTAYVLPTGDLEDFDYVSLGWGLTYRFAGVPFIGR